MAEQVPESHVKNNNGVPPPTDETRDGSCFHFLTKKDEKITEDVVMADPNAPKETLMDELRRSHSHHESSSSDEEVEEGGGEKHKKKKKKGLKEAIVDKLSGEKEDVPVEKCSNAEMGEPEEKKGFLEKIKEKLPGQTKKGEDETHPPAAAAADHCPGSDTKEKKGILDKIKEKLPGHHKNSENETETHAKTRSTNGFNSADEIAKYFGLKRSPLPFLYLLTLKPHQFKTHVFRGANFASAGAGILDKTNSESTVVPLSEQINQFTSLRDNFTAMIGAPETEAMFNKSLFFISIGGNDIFNYSPSEDGTGNAFVSLLISTYSKHITMLYKLGARRFGIVGVPPVGCCPHSRMLHFNKTGTKGCDVPMNDLAKAFHSALETLLLNISSQLPGMKYALGNMYQLTCDAISDPKYLRIFDEVESACCGHGKLNAEGPCNKTAFLCPDRRKYLFWDMYHPTQRASYLAAEAFYFGLLYTSPISFAQLELEY